MRAAEMLPQSPKQPPKEPLSSGWLRSSDGRRMLLSLLVVLRAIPPVLLPESGWQSSSRRLQPSLRPCSTGDQFHFNQHAEAPPASRIE